MRGARRAAAVGAAAAGALLAAPVAATAVRTQVVALPNAAVLLRPPPPLSPPAFAREVRLPRRITSSERVLVGLTSDGAPSSVRVVQRLVIRGAGDYTFLVPAPATEVRPGPGTATPPGLRTNSIVWQGFSPGRRVLSADADLRLAAAAAALPLRIGVETTIGGRAPAPGRRASGPLTVDVAVRNSTGVTVDAFSGKASERDATGALDALRAAVDHDRPTAYQEVHVRGEVEPRRALAAAPFRVHGELRLGVGTVRITGVRRGSGAVTSGPGIVNFDGVVGGTAPPTLHISVRGVAMRASAPRLRIEATPVPPAVDPPARTWAEAVRLRRIRPDGRALLRRAIDLEFAYERSRRYRTFLANPDPLGKSRAAYIFATSRHQASASTTASTSGGGWGAFLIAGVAAGAVLLLGTAVVVWAHL